MKGGLKLHCILQVCTIHLSNFLLTTLPEQGSSYQGADSCPAEQGTLFSSSNFLLMQLSEQYNQLQDEQDSPQLDATRSIDSEIGKSQVVSWTILSVLRSRLTSRFGAKLR